MSNETAIRVENLGKRYRLGQTVDLSRTYRHVLAALPRSLARIAKRAMLDSGASKEADDIFWALRDINFEVERGTVMGIIGRNGAGKSTLLKILTRITEPSEGHAELHGRVGSLLEVGTGFNPELTGRENVYLNGVILGMRKAEIDRKFDKIVAFSGVEHFLDTPVKRYSSGMRVRLAFAVAAHLDPEILLIDEVLAVGDIEFQDKCLGKMEDVTREGRTVLFVSHNMGAISKLCGKCMLLENGRISKIGATNDVIDAYVSQNFERKGELFCEDRPEQDAQILHMAARNAEGGISGILDPLEPITVDIDFVVRKSRRQMHIAFMIAAQDGTRLSESATHMSPGMPQTWPVGRHAIRVVFPPVLNSGRYLIRSGIAQLPNHVIDGHYDGLLVELAEHKAASAEDATTQKRLGYISVMPQYSEIESTTEDIG